MKMRSIGLVALAAVTTVAAAWSKAPSASSSVPAAGWVLEVAGDGNEARYRIREQLVGFNLPNDAIGKTSKVSGRITLDAQGNVIAAASAIEVQVTDLTSDQDRRDNYVRRNTLKTDQFPTVKLRPTAVRGLRFPLPSSGTQKFELVGDLTVLDVTRPTTWQVTANFGRNQLMGSASTRFAFTDFRMTQPRVRSVLSVADTIGLEYDFKFTVSAQ